MSLLEGFTLAGAIVAFVTALFTLWDRWVRGRPRAEVTATTVLLPVDVHEVKIEGRAASPQVFDQAIVKYISIENPGDSNLLILGVLVDPPIYGVGKDRSANIRQPRWKRPGAIGTSFCGQAKRATCRSLITGIKRMYRKTSGSVSSFTGAKLAHLCCGRSGSGIRLRPTTSNASQRLPPERTAFHNAGD